MSAFPRRSRCILDLLVLFTDKGLICLLEGACLFFFFFFFFLGVFCSVATFGRRRFCLSLSLSLCLSGPPYAQLTSPRLVNTGRYPFTHPLMNTTFGNLSNQGIKPYSNKLDVFINGFLKKQLILNGIPKQNYGDVYINSFGGYDGFLSELHKLWISV